jgi:hypothetical protein
LANFQRVFLHDWFKLVISYRTASR